MSAHLYNPPPKVDWFARLDDLRVSCSVCFEDEQDEPLRRIWHLLCDAPDPHWTLGLIVPEPVGFECMLVAGCHEGAARSFLTPEAKLMLAQGSDGGFLATVVLPTGYQGETCADTVALALIGALAAALGEGRLLFSAAGADKTEMLKAA